MSLAVQKYCLGNTSGFRLRRFLGHFPNHLPMDSLFLFFYKGILSCDQVTLTHRVRGIMRAIARIGAMALPTHNCKSLNHM